ncbi:hypothetical protein EV360DRAFT_76064 [Lentinula raphanica]|nr:hypothetical protein EV360DRAFT_76064 [Lentinula raphanica]
MFHNQLIIQSQADVGLDSAKQVLINHFMEDSTDKIVFQGLLKDVLLMSLREILLNKEFKQMKWGSAFADLCFREKVKLINCPAGMKPIGPRDGITGSALVPLHDEDDDKEEDTGMQHKVFFVIKPLLEFFLTNHEEMSNRLYKPKFFIQRPKVARKELQPWVEGGDSHNEKPLPTHCHKPIPKRKVQGDASDNKDEYEGRSR